MSTYAIAFMGDSLFAPNGYGNTPADTNPYRTVQLVRAANPQNVVICRNFGIGGNTTAQMVARMPAMTTYEVPKIAVFYGGANDASASTTVNGVASTTIIPLQSGLGALYGVGSWVVIAGMSAQIQSIAADTLTLTTPLTSAPSSGSVVTIDTRKNLVQMGKFMFTAGCKKIAIHGSHMKNWANGASGDTLIGEETYYGSLRPLQQGAVADLIALGGDGIYIDNLTAMRALISSGVETLYSNCWAAYANNQHLNCVRTRGDSQSRGGGHDVLASNAFTAMQNRGWFSQP